MFRMISSLFYTMIMIIVVLGFAILSAFSTAIFKLVLAMIAVVGVSVTVIFIYAMKDE